MINVEIVHRSTEIGKQSTYDIKDAMSLAGKEAGICYMKDDYFTSKMVEDDRAVSRAEAIIRTGHHSPFDHFSVGVVITGIPKILAMVLNSTEFYTTSEKSARYTVMHPEDPRELELYDKWKDIFAKVIAEKHPKFEAKQVEKLSMENARYVTSVFTPTVMGFTTTFRQYSYLYGWLMDFAEQLRMNSDKFSTELAKSADELADQIWHITENKIPAIKPTKLEFMPFIWGSDDKYKNTISHMNQVCDELYHSRYQCSFACLAQLQRHRTIHYRMSGILSKWYVPPILKGETKAFNGRDLVAEWIADLESIKDCMPQATLVSVDEYGMLNNFVLKCEERLCGRAQLEISDLTRETAEDLYKIVYDSNKKAGIPESRHPLRNVCPNGKAITKCKMRGIQCKEPCVWGALGGITRDI